MNFNFDQYFDFDQSDDTLFRPELEGGIQSPNYHATQIHPQFIQLVPSQFIDPRVCHYYSTAPHPHENINNSFGSAFTETNPPYVNRVESRVVSDFQASSFPPPLTVTQVSANNIAATFEQESPYRQFSINEIVGDHGFTIHQPAEYDDIHNGHLNVSREPNTNIGEFRSANHSVHLQAYVEGSKRSANPPQTTDHLSTPAIEISWTPFRVIRSPSPEPDLLFHSSPDLQSDVSEYLSSSGPLVGDGFAAMELRSRTKPPNVSKKQKAAQCIANPRSRRISNKKKAEGPGRANPNNQTKPRKPSDLSDQQIRAGLDNHRRQGWRYVRANDKLPTFGKTVEIRAIFDEKGKTVTATLHGEFAMGRLYAISVDENIYESFRRNQMWVFDSAYTLNLDGQTTGDLTLQRNDVRGKIDSMHLRVLVRFVGGRRDGQEEHVHTKGIGRTLKTGPISVESVRMRPRGSDNIIQYANLSGDGDESSVPDIHSFMNLEVPGATERARYEEGTRTEHYVLVQQLCATRKISEELIVIAERQVGLFIVHGRAAQDVYSHRVDTEGWFHIHKLDFNPKTREARFITKPDRPRSTRKQKAGGEHMSSDKKGFTVGPTLDSREAIHSRGSAARSNGGRDFQCLEAPYRVKVGTTRCSTRKRKQVLDDDEDDSQYEETKIHRNLRQRRRDSPKNEDSEGQQEIENDAGGEDGDHHDLENMSQEHDEDDYVESDETDQSDFRMAEAHKVTPKRRQSEPRPESKDPIDGLASAGYPSSLSPMPSELLDEYTSSGWFQETLESSLDIDLFASVTPING